MSIQNAVRTAISGAAITLVATLVSIYIVSQFLRNSIGVIAPNLASDLNLSPAQIGLLSSVFFLAFAAVQIPLGMALDRFGPRICLVVGAAITVIGALVFACAASPGVPNRCAARRSGAETRASPRRTDCSAPRAADNLRSSPTSCPACLSLSFSLSRKFSTPAQFEFATQSR